MIDFIAGVLVTIAFLWVWAWLRNDRGEEAPATAERAPHHDATALALRRIHARAGPPARETVHDVGAYEAAIDAEIEEKLGAVIGSGEGPLRFEYADAHGEVSEREISEWKEHRRHVRGYCHLRHAERTFAKSRILEWHDGCEAALMSPYD